eukprot:TRINITY_DN5879_c0_g1_i1.p1 TRINITY_DN5879_c0_g1~~TRINITY_DN5879_c0_g1_i1.p1  ORF type:complete len:156 (+),score=40.19 TRINITY_DN5879_c0_g1_i1:418-885(+)
MPTIEQVRKVQKEFDPIHLAASLPDSAILKRLTQDRKSLINIIDNEKRNATPLHYAVLNNSLENVQYLIRKGALLNAQDYNGNTPMHIAVLEKRHDALRMLIEENADARVQNYDNLSPIDLSFTDKDKSILNYFRSLSQYTDIFRKKQELSLIHI